MKSFVFTMARVRNYKQQLLDGEKNLLRHLRRERDEIADRLEGLRAYRRDTEAAFQKKQAAGVSYQELQGHQYCMESARRSIEEGEKELAAAEAEIERQLQVVIAATQEVSGLDKLEEKQREEYSRAAAAESREQVLEQVSTKESRRKQNA